METETVFGLILFSIFIYLIVSTIKKNKTQIEPFHPNKISYAYDETKLETNKGIQRYKTNVRDANNLNYENYIFGI